MGGDAGQDSAQQCEEGGADLPAPSQDASLSDLEAGVRDFTNDERHDSNEHDTPEPGAVATPEPAAVYLFPHLLSLCINLSLSLPL